MANNIGEDAPVKVRFKHLGVEFAGARRAVCRPTDLKLQLVTDIEKVTCPHCKLRMDEFFEFMETQKALGNLPE